MMKSVVWLVILQHFAPRCGMPWPIGCCTRKKCVRNCKHLDVTNASGFRTSGQSYSLLIDLANSDFQGLDSENQNKKKHDNNKR